MQGPGSPANSPFINQVNTMRRDAYLAVYRIMYLSARTYITGPGTDSSNIGHGKSDVMLPGLGTEVKKVRPILRSKCRMPKSAIAQAGFCQ